jgi:fused signal recognition particle receptor
MFGSLKKKLKEAISKVAGKVEEKAQEQPVPSEPKVQIELVREVEVIAKEKAPLEEKEVAKEAKKEIHKKKEEVETEKPQEKKSGILKRFAEKELSESDIKKILDALQIALLESDVAVEVATRICDEVKEKLLGKSIKRGKTEEVIKDALRQALLDVTTQKAPDVEDLVKQKEGPLLVVFFGFNGTGKTTTIAKLAHLYKKYKPILAAGDTFRAASIEQLEEHGHRLDVEVMKHKYGSDSAAVIFDAVKHANSIGSKLVLADTAGRSHANVNLMDELKKVIRVNKPDLKVLVLDSLTGNDIYDQAKLFNDAIGADAIIMTKADVYEKGGAAISAAWTIRKPILFLGTGQEYGDLQPFNAEKIVKEILG